MKPNADFPLTLEAVTDFRQEFAHDKANTVALNAITQGEVNTLALNHQILAQYPLTFSEEISSGNLTNQKDTNRCWTFAALNFMRQKTIKKLSLNTFEFSQSYIMFYDKLERCNYFLENILGTLDRDTHSRLLTWLLADPMDDAGQWDMFVTVVEKYGVVPKEVYPESVSSSATKMMNSHLNEKLREYAWELRAAYSNGANIESLRTRKNDMLRVMYRVLSIHNGVPPERFHWSYRDKDNGFHTTETPVTPQEFYRQYAGVDLQDYVSLISCPTEDKPYNNHYTVGFLGNIVGGKKISYLNVDISTMKQLALNTLKTGEAVWFGCDVAKHYARREGILHSSAYQMDLLYSDLFKMDKAARVSYGHSQMTHAMLFTGVHEEQGKPTRWKVEDSFGTANNNKGFLVMSDCWFDEYVFQVVLPKAQIPENLLALLDAVPIVLNPWDPMGALA